MPSGDPLAASTLVAPTFGGATLCLHVVIISTTQVLVNGALTC
jgi:hypothetical protein